MSNKESITLTAEEVGDLLAGIILSDHLGDAYDAAGVLAKKIGMECLGADSFDDLEKSGYLPAHHYDEYWGD